MSEAPVGPHYVDPGPRTRYIPPPPVVYKTEPKPVEIRKIQPPPPTRQAPARVVRRAPEPREPTRSRRQIASSVMTNESYVPRVRTAAPRRSHSSHGTSNWMFSAFYNLAKEASYEGSTSVSGQSQSFSATETSSPGMGLAGGYMYRPSTGFGFNGQLQFEYGRTATSMSGQAGGSNLGSNYGAGYSTNTFTGAANGLYSMGGLYLYGGINYPYVMGSSSVQLSGLPGYQAGAGYALTRKWGVHTEYRAIRMKGTLQAPPSNLEVSEASLKGFMLFVDFSI